MEFIITLLMMVAWIWLIVIAFKSDETAWGVVMILFPPICVIYALMNFNKAKIPLVMIVLSVALIATLSPEQIAALEQE